MPTPLKGPHPHPHLWRLPRHLDVWSRGLVTGRVVMRRPHLAHAVKMNLLICLAHRGAYAAQRCKQRLPLSSRLSRTGSAQVFRATIGVLAGESKEKTETTKKKWTPVSCTPPEEANKARVARLSREVVKHIQLGQNSLTSRCKVSRPLLPACPTGYSGFDAWGFPVLLSQLSWDLS